MVSGGAANEARVRTGLFRFPRRTTGRSYLAAAIMARGVHESTDCHTGAGNLRSGNMVDDIDRRSGLHYARELHELADILFHAEVRAVLAADAWVRFFIVRVTESHRNNCWLRGFLGRVSFLANIDFSQTVAGLRAGDCPRDWHGCVLDGNTGTIQRRYRNACLSAPDGLPGGARYPGRRVSIVALSVVRARVGHA